MTVKPTLVILAAGVGSRYGGLKQLTPVGPSGEALLEYAVFDALRSGFARVLLVVRPESEGAFRDRFDSGMGRHIPLTYVHQVLDGRVKPWGTGQAVLAAEGEIEGTFVVINADDFYGVEAFAEIARFLGQVGRVPVPTVAVVGFRVADTLTDAGPVCRAQCQLDEAGLVREIVELKEVWRHHGGVVYRDAAGVQRALDGDELVSMNMWALHRDLLPALRRLYQSFRARAGLADDAEFLLPDAIQTLVQEAQIRVRALRGSGPWCGITFAQDEARVMEILSALVAEGRYPKELWA